MKGAQTASVQFYVSIFIWSYCFAILKVFSKWTECSFHKCGFWDLQLSIVSSAVCISSSLSGSVVVTKYWRLSLGKQAGSLPERTPQKNEEYWARACQTGFIGAIALSQNISLAEALKLCSLVFLVHGVLTVSCSGTKSAQFHIYKWMFVMKFWMLSVSWTNISFWLPF